MGHLQLIRCDPRGFKGSRGSSEMLKNYKELKVWQKSYELCLETRLLLSDDLNYVNKENLKDLKDNTEEVEKMLKALIKSLENKRLDP